MAINTATLSARGRADRGSGRTAESEAKCPSRGTMPPVSRAGSWALRGTAQRHLSAAGFSFIPSFLQFLIEFHSSPAGASGRGFSPGKELSSFSPGRKMRGGLERLLSRYGRDGQRAPPVLMGALCGENAAQCFSKEKNIKKGWALNLLLLRQDTTARSAPCKAPREPWLQSRGCRGQGTFIFHQSTGN